MDDQTIINLLKQDEEQGYSMLIDHYTSYVAAIVASIGKGHLNSSDVEEVAADVFFKVWCKRQQIRTSSIKAFIAQIARNATIDRLRTKHVEFLPYDDDVIQVVNREMPDALAEIREQTQIIKDAVHSFEEPDREIFIRFYYFGEPIKVIAEKLQLKISTTKTKLHRTRIRLREIMYERGYENAQQ